MSCSSAAIRFSSSAFGLFWVLRKEEVRQSLECAKLYMTSLLELRHPSFSLRDPFLAVLNVELELGNGDLDFRNPFLQVCDLTFDRLAARLECRELLLGLLALLLVPRNHLRLDSIRLEPRAHTSALDASASSAHSTRRLDKVSTECDDLPPAFAVGDPVGLLERFGDNRLARRLEESLLITLVLGLDEVKEPGNSLGRLQRGKVSDGELVEDKDVGATARPTEVLNDRLALCDGVGDKRVKAASTGCRNGDVILVVDGAEVAEPTL